MIDTSRAHRILDIGVLTVAVLLAGESAAAGTGDPQQTNMNLSRAVHSHESMFTSSANESGLVGGFYKGKLKDGTEIAANLLYSGPSRNRGMLIRNGVFWYPSSFDGRVFPLKAKLLSSPRLVSLRAQMDSVPGTRDWKGQLSIEGPSLQGNFIAPLDSETEMLDQTFEGKIFQDGRTIKGTWTDAVHHRALTFKLLRVFEYREVSKPLPTEEKHGTTASVKFDAVFPELPFSSVSEDIEASARVCVSDDSCENEISVVGFDDELLTVRTYQTSKPIGAPAEYGAKYSTYRVARGAATPMKLSELLNPSHDCTEKIGSIVRSRLIVLLDAIDQKLRLPNLDDDGVLDLTSGFIISSETLTVHFSPEDLGSPFGLGEFLVTLSKTELGKCYVSPKS